MVSVSEHRRWQQKIFDVYDKIRRDKKPYWMDADGIQLLVLPNVFSPNYFVESVWFAKKVREIVGTSSLLEIGPGTGIIALFVGLHGSKVTAVDINPAAVKNTKLNFQYHRIKASIRKGDLYEPLKKNEKFDFIFWNHPFNDWHEPVSDVLLLAGFDTQYRALERYIAKGKNHLTKKGRLLLGTADFANLPHIRALAARYSYRLKRLKKANFPVEPKSKIRNNLLIYEFVKQ